MRSFTPLSASLFAATTSAFPQALSSTILSDLTNLASEALGALQVDSLNASTTTFSPQAQLIDVSGDHEWQAPGPTDARGPCPGLNALANHNYLPRSGYANILQLTTATSQVYGMGLDLSTILSAYGAALDGALISWSIGGQEHTGISGSHGNYETDSSPMRGDLFQYGSNSDVVVGQFKQLFDMQPDAATANYDINVLGEFRSARFNESIAKNPYFYYGPFSGNAVSQAAFTFIYRFMANHTAAEPNGILNQDVLKSFFGISGSSADDFTWTAGQERIPENWYRRALDSPYGLLTLSNDIQSYYDSYPFIANPGCNTGKVNSYHAINTTDTDAADYDFSKPLDGVCYGVATALDVAAGVPVVGDVVQELLLPLQNGLSCPTVSGSKKAAGKACPGYATYGGPTAKIAPGAIQDPSS